MAQKNTKHAKSPEIHSEAELQPYVDTVGAAAHRAMTALILPSQGLPYLHKMKFDPIGYDPLDITRRINVIEQINQTFTYLASFAAAKILFGLHPNCGLRLNLGTASGSDIESVQDGFLAAEVFAAVTPRNNKKLRKDIDKVCAAQANHRYVFYYCPNEALSQQEHESIFERTKVIVRAVDLKREFPSLPL